MSGDDFLDHLDAPKRPPVIDRARDDLAVAGVIQVAQWLGL